MGVRKHSKHIHIAMYFKGHFMNRKFIKQLYKKRCLSLVQCPALFYILPNPYHRTTLHTLLTLVFGQVIVFHLHLCVVLHDIVFRDNIICTRFVKTFESQYTFDFAVQLVSFRLK